MFSNTIQKILTHVLGWMMPVSFYRYSTKEGYHFYEKRGKTLLHFASHMSTNLSKFSFYQDWDYFVKKKNMPLFKELDLINVK